MDLRYVSDEPLGNRQVELTLSRTERQSLYSFHYSFIFEALSGRIGIDKRNDPPRVMTYIKQYADVGEEPVTLLTSEQYLHDMADFVMFHAEHSTHMHIEGGIRPSVAKIAQGIVRAIQEEMLAANGLDCTIPDQLPPDFV